MKQLLLYTVFLLVIVTAAPNVYGQVCGCTDPLATNFNAAATVNDGSCTYASTTISPTEIGQLDSVLAGTSGMIFWNGGFWTYNDHDDCCLYRLDSADASTVETLCVSEITNYDTEEISQDSLYLYLGDFGNNAGTRQDLRILRINKATLLNHTPQVDTIWFSYEDQTDFTSHPLATDFDCEAFVVTNDSIFLFTKQWATEQTTVYGLPKLPGTYQARNCSTYNVGGLVTGSTYIPGKQLVVLCGYDYNSGDNLSSLHPFIILLYDFQGNSFFSGNKRRLNFGTFAKNQIEAIATCNSLDYYITNESFSTTQLGISIDFPAKLHKLDLSPYLSPYLSGNDVAVNSAETSTIPTLYPNPASDCLYLKQAQKFEGVEYTIWDARGRCLGGGILEEEKILLSPYHLTTGNYILLLHGKTQALSLKFMVGSPR